MAIRPREEDLVEMKRVRDLLPTELFEGSKDWREGNTVDRIEWLLSMYAGAKEEIARLEETLIHRHT